MQTFKSLGELKDVRAGKVFWTDREYKMLTKETIHFLVTSGKNPFSSSAVLEALQKAQDSILLENRRRTINVINGTLKEEIDQAWQNWLSENLQPKMMPIQEQLAVVLGELNEIKKKQLVTTVKQEWVEPFKTTKAELAEELIKPSTKLKVIIAGATPTQADQIRQGLSPKEQEALAIDWYDSAKASHNRFRKVDRVVIIPHGIKEDRLRQTLKQCCGAGQHRTLAEPYQIVTWLKNVAQRHLS